MHAKSCKSHSSGGVKVAWGGGFAGHVSRKRCVFPTNGV